MGSALESAPLSTSGPWNESSFRRKQRKGFFLWGGGERKRESMVSMCEGVCKWSVDKAAAAEEEEG